jgi:hypothetical protein
MRGRQAQLPAQPVEHHEELHRQGAHKDTHAREYPCVPDKPNYPLNLWSIMKNCIGKELTKIPMPVSTHACPTSPTESKAPTLAWLQWLALKYFHINYIHSFMS